jgi:PHD/YefM family antitoxin component YafN of YafNO toxin-antitoxin module
MLIQIHPNFIEKKGKKEFVVLPIEEYEKIQDTLEDYEDLIDLRKAKAKEKNKKSLSLLEVKRKLGLAASHHKTSTNSA